MRHIVIRLLESRKIIDPMIFNFPVHSEEIQDLHDTIHNTLIKSAKKILGDDVNVIDAEIKREGTVLGNSQIIYSVKNLVRVDSENNYKYLNSQEVEELTDELKKIIILPDKDDEYEYKIEYHHNANTFRITLSRYEI